MWYFTWILGVLLACAFGIVNAMWLELNGYVGDDQVKADVKKTISQLPAITNSIVTAMDATKQTITKVGNNASQRLSELQPLTVQLGEQGPAIVADINKKIQNLDGLFAGL